MDDKPITVEVLHVISGLGVGGAETMLAELVLDARAKGRDSHAVVSLTPGGDNADRLRAAGVAVLEFDLRRPMRIAPDLARLTKEIRRLRPKVIQGWMYHADLAATLALFLSGRRSATRLYWGVRCSDMDVSRYGVRLRAAIRACVALSRQPDAIVANSHAGAAYHRTLGYRANQWIVIDNGVDTDRFRPNPEARRRVRAALDAPEGRLLLAHVARVDPMKDHAAFLAALDRLPDVVAVAVGQGTESLPERPNLRRLGRRHDMPDVLAAADIIVSSSAFGEGFSTALSEGMAAGLIPVATDVGDARRIVGDAGEITPPRDPEALAQAIGRVVALPPDGRAARGRAARERIQREFSLARAAEAFARLHGSF